MLEENDNVINPNANYALNYSTINNFFIIGHPRDIPWIIIFDGRERAAVIQIEFASNEVNVALNVVFGNGPVQSVIIWQLQVHHAPTGLVEVLCLLNIGQFHSCCTTIKK